MNILVTRKVYEQMSKFFNTNGTFALVEDDTLNLSSTRKWNRRISETFLKNK